MYCVGYDDLKQCNGHVEIYERYLKHGYTVVCANCAKSKYQRYRYAQDNIKDIELYAFVGQ